MANVAINNITDTWNSSGTTFTGIKFNVTDTASAAASLLMDLQVGGTSRFKVDKAGIITTGSIGANLNNSFYWNDGLNVSYSGYPTLRSKHGLLAIAEYAIFGWSNNGNVSANYLALTPDSANTLAQRNGVNAQTNRLYGTYTDASNYRRVSLSMDTAGTADLKAEGAGTGVTGNILRVEAAAYRLASNAVITDSSTARTLTAADNGRVIYFTSATAVTVTTAVGLGTGFTCTLIQGGAGQITVAADASTAVVSYGSFTKTAGQYAAISAMCPVADTFYLSGDLA